ncbi:hypothetical protein ABIG06_005703 [Bradyrhizobium sp. USDA 326]
MTPILVAVINFHIRQSLSALGVPGARGGRRLERIGDAAVFGVTSTIGDYAIAGCGLGCRDSASTISAANTHSAPAMKNAGR